MAGGVEDLELDPSEIDALAVVQLADRELGVGHRRVADFGSGRLGQFEVAGKEVGVEVGLEHQLDGEALGLGVTEVLVDVAAGVDDHGPPSALVTDQVGGLGQAVEVVLGEDHRRLPLRLGGSLLSELYVHYTPRGI